MVRRPDPSYPSGVPPSQGAGDQVPPGTPGPRDPGTPIRDPRDPPDPVSETSEASPRPRGRGPEGLFYINPSRRPPAVPDRGSRDPGVARGLPRPGGAPSRSFSIVRCYGGQLIVSKRSLFAVIALVHDEYLFTRQGAPAASQRRTTPSREGEGFPLRPYSGTTPGRLGGAGYPHPPPGTAGPRRERLM